MEEIKNLIELSHNPSLIDVNLSPNENTIYHIYSDGEITEQKGGLAYGRRSERTIFNSLYKSLPFDFFPNFITNHLGDKHGFAIVTYDDALKIRVAIQNTV